MRLSGGEEAVAIPVGTVTLNGNLSVPRGAQGLVLFAHGSGSSRKSWRNRFVAEALRTKGLGTLLFDLLTTDEEVEDEIDAHLRFDIPLLAERLAAVTTWMSGRELASGIPIGYFGASTGAAAALIAAAELPDAIGAVVSRGGRPDLARASLGLVRAPTLLIVGGDDAAVLEMNREALRSLEAPKQLAIVPGATHLFEEPGALEEVARLAASWFTRHLCRADAAGIAAP